MTALFEVRPRTALCSHTRKQAHTGKLAVMADKAMFVVQVFERRHKRKLLALPKIEAASEAHARYQAENLAARKAEAAVLALTMDTQSGQVTGLRVLARFGAVPDSLGQRQA